MKNGGVGIHDPEKRPVVVTGLVAMAPWRGFEPLTSSSAGRRSIH